MPPSPKTFTIKEITKDDAARLIQRFHYSKVLPKLNKKFIGGFVDGELVAVMTLGWGVQPKATIKKMFPSLDTKDYYEIGKLCLDEKMPRNSESEFISGCINHIKRNSKQIKVLYSWSDGMLGKPGFVYQSSNFLYGGFIWTDSYFTKDGIKIHPRSTKELCRRNAKEIGKPKVFWLTEEFQNRNGIIRYKGKQFRYVYFLCSHKERKRLLSESGFRWNATYPKTKDCIWKRKIEGEYIECEKPLYKCSSNAREVSRAETILDQRIGVGAIPTSRTLKIWIDDIAERKK